MFLAALVMCVAVRTPACPPPVSTVQSASRVAAARHRRIELLSNDAVIVIGACGLAGAAGWLQYSVSSGEKGLNAFLMKEKRDNPFYSKTFTSEKPKPPPWLAALKLPSLDFVEVYGQDKPAPRQVDGSMARLYAELDAAIEREDYVEAKQIKQRIDASLTGGAS